MPLVPVSVSILEWAYQAHPCHSGEYIFNGTDGVSPLQGWSRAQERILNAWFAEAGEEMRPWTPHDFRRTAAAPIGVRSHHPAGYCMKSELCSQIGGKTWPAANAVPEHTCVS